jgi:hypothetical protein
MENYFIKDKKNNSKKNKLLDDVMKKGLNNLFVVFVLVKQVHVYKDYVQFYS